MITKIKTNPITKTPKNISFHGVYNNKLLLKSLKFASENSSLFTATTALVLSAIRPISILLTPKTDRKNKQIACAKSFASSAVGYTIMLGASIPVAKAVKQIDKFPSAFLKKTTIKNLKGSADKLTNSKRYMFSTQLFKLGLGLILAFPKSAMTCTLIPPIFNNIFSKNNSDQKDIKKTSLHNKYNSSNGKEISFKGIYNQSIRNLAKGIGKIIDSKPVQKAAENLCETNFAQHIMNLTDVVMTGAFINQTKKSKNIENNSKKALIHNSIISTGLCITGGYAINKALEKPTEAFIKNFRAANKELADIEKYVEGIRIAKPALILGGIYYIIIPVLSTFLADRTSQKFKN